MLEATFIRLLDDLASGLPTYGNGYFPPADIHEEGDKVTLFLDVPGVKKDQIEVTLNGRLLTIVGVRKPTVEVQNGERHHGRFRRQFTLSPIVDASTMKADLSDGILTVTVGKTEAAKPRRITVGG